jgi:hypothetical protein
MRFSTVWKSEDNRQYHEKLQPVTKPQKLIFIFIPLQPLKSI